MAKSINLTGTAGKTYNLDTIQNTQTRTNSNEELLVQIWYWNPNLPATNSHSNPNPPSPVLGQMWLSKLVAKGTPEYLEIEGAE